MNREELRVYLAAYKKAAADKEEPKNEAPSNSRKHEIAGSILGPMTLGTIPPLNLGLPVGLLHGILSGDLHPSNKTGLSNYLPGVGTSRYMRRRRNRDRELSGGKRNRSPIVHEAIGGMGTAPLISSAIGGLVAKAVKQPRVAGAVLGGITAMGAQVGGIFLGMLRSNIEKRKKYLKNGMWKNYVIPGHGGYQAGAAMADVWKNG